MTKWVIRTEHACISMLFILIYQRQIETKIPTDPKDQKTLPTFQLTTSSKIKSVMLFITNSKTLGFVIFKYNNCLIGNRIKFDE